MAYSNRKHAIALADALLTPFIFLLLILSGASRSFADLFQYIRSPYVGLVLYIITIAFSYYIIHLPVSFYSDFFLEHSFGLSNQGIGAWSKKVLKEALLGMIIDTLLAICVYISLRFWPLRWWLITGVAWFVLTIIVARITPTIILPLFYKYSPIKREGLKKRLENLVTSCGFNMKGVFEIDFSKDTKKANAAVIGLGREKKIVLCDTLLNAFSDDEIEVVMAHELGHHKLRHNMKLILFSSAATFAVLYITNIAFLKVHSIFYPHLMLSDFESIILIYTIVLFLTLPLRPVYNAFSRKLEKEADLFALNITGNREAFVSTMEKLSRQNLADKEPHKIFEILLYTHPPLSRRISMARSYAG